MLNRIIRSTVLSLAEGGTMATGLYLYHDHQFIAVGVSICALMLAYADGFFKWSV